MKIEGYSEDQIAALCDIWHLRKPIDVSGFMKRADIPDDAKASVRQAGVCSDPGSDAAAGHAYRLMQAQIIMEVAKLDKQRWNPMGPGLLIPC